MMRRHRKHHSPRRNGIILITAMGILLVLGGLVLVLARNMRTEAMASSNRVSQGQADAIELGAEQWVEANVDLYTTDAGSVTQVPGAALQVGNGYFWVLHPNDTDDTQFDFGITDESGKLNLNSVTAAELMTLPMNLPQDVADAIVDWRSPAAAASSDGAESDYYESLQEPYDAKNSPYETVEELLLVKGVTPQVLFGLDLNRNGVIEPDEQNQAGNTGIGGAGISTGQNGDRGLFDDVTVYSLSPGKGAPQVGLVNVLTANEDVLSSLPGLSQSDAEAIIDSRDGYDGTQSTNWLGTILGTQKYAGIRTLVTMISYQYSADIIAVSGDGRGFKRVRIVVDCRTTPCKIVYRKDLTSYGWPLPADVRTSLRNGQGVPAYMASDETVGSNTNTR